MRSKFQHDLAIMDDFIAIYTQVSRVHEKTLEGKLAQHREAECRKRLGVAS